ncbi:MAG TPA: acetate--CoA ligase family protein [Stellaceae bacterium]|nr:acetate--CoA ligase family protein [Stellaceae bacterium]
MSRLSRLLRPRSIAVFGGASAAEVVRQCRKIGYDGAIWPVHPRHDTIEGLPVYRSVAGLPAAPDAAFVAVNRHLSVEVMGQLAQRGAGGVVAYASGFAEVGGEGIDLQAQLVAAAGDMPFIGPNCYGLLSYLDGVTLWPDQHGGKRVERGVAIVTQSGNIGLNLTMQRRALPIAYLVTLGNQASVGLSEAIAALAEDDRVTAIGLHVEGIDDPAAFARACAVARERGKPVVALKTGSSQTGAELTISHTASLAGADAVVDAFFRRVGVVRVASIPVLLEALKVLHLHGPMTGRNIASLSCSGGEAALIADTVERHNLHFGRFDAARKEIIAATLTELVTISNPFDYHTFAWGDEPALTDIFAATMDAEFDTTLIILDFPREDRCDGSSWEVSMRALAAASKRTGRRGGVVTSMPESMTEAQAEGIAALGLVPLYGIDDALAALEAAADAGEFARGLPAAPAAPTPSPSGLARTLSEWEGKKLLQTYGLTVPEGCLVRPGEDAAETAAALGFPVALKAVGSAIAHKTEMGAVKLGLAGREAVREAAAALSGIGEALLVERMVTDSVAELIVGVARDPVCGLQLVIGAGGQLVELIADSRILLLPASRAEIAAAVRSLKSAKLLQGYRNRPAGDIDAVASAVLAIQEFVLAEGSRLIELDVNPLMVRPHGAVAADVLIRLAEEGE